MGTASSSDAYPSARALLDKAISAKNGIKVTLPEYGQAVRMRHNCYTVRLREQERSKKIYSQDMPQYGRSVWDKISIRVLKGEEGKGILILNHSEEILDGIIEEF